MTAEPLNVFKGQDALADYFNPDRNPMLPLVELPDALNILRADGIRIFAKMLTALPAHNVKSLPALKMIQNQGDARHKTIVEASSGSTVLSMGIISRVLWGLDNVHAYVSNKKHPDSLKLLRFFGVKPTLYGGLAQQEPSDPNGIMARLRQRAASDGDICYPGQYHNDHNWQSHELWTGPQIWRQLPEINIFCSTIGTGGCITGIGKHMKAMKPSVKVLGVCNQFGDPTPGPRHFPGFETSQFPWRETIDFFETVSSVDAFRMSMRLSRHGIIAGPSSGEALHALISFLSKAKIEGCLDELREGATGEINCVFTCQDLPYQYMNLYYDKLSDDEFPSIANENLLFCDSDPYDERWFLTPEQALALLSKTREKTTLCTSPHDESPCPVGLAPWPTKSADPASRPSTAPSSADSISSKSIAESSESSVQSVDSFLISCPSLAVVDIRPAGSFTELHINGACNIPLSDTEHDLFGSPDAVEKRWRELKGSMESGVWPLLHQHHHQTEPTIMAGKRAATTASVLVVCTDGDSSRMACSMLRGRGVKAYCVNGGFSALVDHVEETFEMV